ncbi:class I SAM-dependent methyltransferase [Cupriavidus basilensis]
MAGSAQSFQEFERAGWEDPATVSGYDQNLSGVTIQSIGALLDAAAVGDGTQVLDVATGAGYVAAAAARRGAHPVGIDFAAAQVGMARQRYPDLRFEQADAQALPFEPGTFDAVVNAFGMCHLPDPDLALREALRVLKPGGRVAFTVWDVPERAVGFGALYAAVRAHGTLDVGLPAGPNFFLFSDPDACAKALLGAGFVSPPAARRRRAGAWRRPTNSSRWSRRERCAHLPPCVRKARKPGKPFAQRSGTPLPPMPAATPSTCRCRPCWQPQPGHSANAGAAQRVA